VKINPRGQVPVLVHGDYALDESTLINEYVDDTFPGPPLKPSDAYGRHQMRVWTKFVDEYFCPALSFLGWHAMIKNATAHLSEAEFEPRWRVFRSRSSRTSGASPQSRCGLPSSSPTGAARCRYRSAHRERNARRMGDG
jgi:glutathione S-transferase